MEEQKKAKNNKSSYLVIVVILLIVFILWLTKRENSLQYKMSSGIVWTTQYHITYESDKKLDDSIQIVFNNIDNSLSMFNKSSLITRINNGENVKVDSMLSCLYETSVMVNKHTEGAFDPTVSPLMKMWGFINKTGTLPDSTQIDSIMNFVGIGKTSLKDGYIKKNDVRISFDFSAIAKGYACDEVGRMMERNGVKNYLVEIGGEIAVKGVNPSGEKWRISVDKPIETNDSVAHENMLVIAVSEGGIATSGNYRNYKDIDGRKVVHTMNPLTGYPEESNLLSVTIVAENCMLADAYATGCMVMGVEKCKSFLESNEKIGALLIYSSENDSLKTWSNEKFKAVRG